MPTKFSVIVLSVLALSAAGCTVHHQFVCVTPSWSELGVPQMPLTVAVLADPSFTFDYPRIVALRSFVEVMNPGLANAIRNAFSTRFSSVIVVGSREAAANVDLLATPTMDLSDPPRLTVRFVAPRTGDLVAELSAKHAYDSHAPGMYSYIATDMMLFAAAVTFPPSDMLVAHEIQKHTAKRFNAMFEPAVAQMVNDIASQTSRDRGLTAFVRGARPQPVLTAPPVYTARTTNPS